MRKAIGKIKNKNEEKRWRRRLAIRKNVQGVGERPRLVLNKANRNLRVQAIDDAAGRTLCSIQTFGKNGLKAKANKEGAKLMGVEMAKRLKEQKIEAAVFDRAGYAYHGVVAALADAIRENGIRI